MSNNQHTHRDASPGANRFSASPSPVGMERHAQRLRRGRLFRWGLLLLGLFLSLFILRRLVQPDEISQVPAPVGALPPPVNSAVADTPAPAAVVPVAVPAVPSGQVNTSARVVVRAPRSKQPVAGPVPTVVPENSPPPPLQMVYGTSMPGEENPFLPEESHAGTPPAAQQCEDETVPAVSPAPAAVEATPADSVIAEPVRTKPENGTSKRRRSKKLRIK